MEKGTRCFFFLLGYERLAHSGTMKQSPDWLFGSGSGHSSSSVKSYDTLNIVVILC